MSREFFFRNDDIRDSLDVALIRIQDMFIARAVPIVHAVEPANVTPEVVTWLREKKLAYSDLITLMQHGYEHKVKNQIKKGEFGGQRGFDEQYEEIRRGKERMDELFGELWFRAFNFPYGPYNKAAIRALEKVGYRVLNSHYNIEWKRQIFYRVGHLLRTGYLLNRHVSWNMNMYPGTSMYEISMNITFIKKYYNEQTDCDFFSFEEICSRIDRYRKSPYPVGLLLHHRYHVTEESMNLIARVLDYLDGAGFQAVSMERLYDRLCAKAA